MELTKKRKITANKIVFIVGIQFVLWIVAAVIWSRPHIWCWSGAKKFQEENCPTKELIENALYAAKKRAEAEKNPFYYERRKEDLKKARDVCLNWRVEFDNSFKTACKYTSYGKSKFNWVLGINFSIEFGMFMLTQWQIMNRRTLIKPYVIGILLGEIAALGFTFASAIVAVIHYIQDEIFFNASNGYKEAKADCGYNGEIFTVQFVFLILSSGTILYTLGVAVKMYKRRGSYADNNPKHIEMDGRSETIEINSIASNSALPS